MSVNADVEDWGGAGSNDSGERAWLLQSPSVDSVQQLEPDRRSSGVSSMGAVFIVVNAALGAGLLNFPAAFNMAGGVTAGVVLQMFMLIFIISGLVILGYCSQVSNEATYQEVVRATCGKVTGVLCEVAIAVYTFGTCIAFFIVIGDQLDRLIAAAAHNADGTDSHYWYTDRKFTIAVTAVIVILPLSIPKEIGFQKYASALSVMGTWYVTIVVIIKYIWPDKEVIPGYIPTSSASWTAVFNAMPTICFGFQCHVSSVPVFNSMRRKEIKPWGVVVTFSMIICLFVYTGTGVCGFLTFGSSVSQDVLMSYPPDDIAVAIARAFIIICVVTSYPILHFCGRAVIEGLWLRFQGEQVEVCVRRERRRRILQTLVWFFVTLILALFIPDIGRVISLIGGLAACFIFVFPGLCLMQAKLSETDSRSASWHGLVIFGVAMVTLGAFIFGLTTTNSIYQDIVN
ncbi:sodium-coupled neutral amino acid transporter 7 [Archocentrus centrarchus]|uniref:sodium-coupled neutral amino acid transporter 7 n=1 Tax=Archocentrus centrarchus TaxID=63155 RepID=UPI0011E9DE9D|nr:putative sodium-coupled neutral amino acid transporter 7 [Archocentrus centrarchus]XP_030581981.1 putative sodium-coupled neutral amino acid transporter 7 [Archocentrus centrarchus]XP_030581982.1 putative sodium-coupled neutral amino acid transporter 7 [Archocentrus centrarchus]